MASYRRSVRRNVWLAQILVVLGLGAVAYAILKLPSDAFTPPKPNTVATRSIDGPQVEVRTPLPQNEIDQYTDILVVLGPEAVDPEPPEAQPETPDQPDEPNEDDEPDEDVAGSQLAWRYLGAIGGSTGRRAILADEDSQYLVKIGQDLDGTYAVASIARDHVMLTKDNGARARVDLAEQTATFGTPSTRPNVAPVTGRRSSTANPTNRANVNGRSASGVPDDAMARGRPGDERRRAQMAAEILGGKMSEDQVQQLYDAGEIDKRLYQRYQQRQSVIKRKGESKR